jgi:enoyl-CoA hydratase/carnithine racemase
MTELLVTRHEHTVVLTLNRPEAGNRLTTSLATEVAVALEAARSDDTARACVLTGAGDVFCLGGDYRGAGHTRNNRQAYARALLRMDRAMAALGKPLVAAVNGAAHAGFSVVAACDLAVAATEATFGLPEAASGLFPFIALAIVKDTLPKKVLFDLVYTARLLDSAEALSLHLVNEIADRPQLLERTLERAREAGAHRPGVIALGRDLYYAMRGLDADESLDRAERALLAALELPIDGPPRRRQSHRRQDN